MECEGLSFLGTIFDQLPVTALFVWAFMRLEDKRQAAMQRRDTLLVRIVSIMTHQKPDITLAEIEDLHN